MKVFARELLQFLYWNQSSLFDGILPGRGCYICFWFQSRVIFPGKRLSHLVFEFNQVPLKVCSLVKVATLFFSVDSTKSM
jgi:hypothetical protein